MVLFNDRAIGESFELSRLCMVGAIEFLDVRVNLAVVSAAPGH
ncbi:hypothetical protein N9B60_05020 [Mariniblastus sp.]|nr:hypothetical protein [Mariniblastus sp.]MDB4357282.1 hypothetical protein [Mariniblastus sp.]